MGAEADAICAAGYAVRSEQRRNTRNGVPGSGVGHPGIELAIPKLAMCGVK
jgi:hypothetical protein